MRKRIVIALLSFVAASVVALGVFMHHQVTQAAQSDHTWGIPSQSVLQNLPPAKQQLFKSIASQETTGYNGYHAPKSYATLPSTCPEHIAPYIFQVDKMIEAEHIDISTYAMQNEAIFTDPLRGFKVYAGSLVSNPAQGILYVTSFPNDICSTAYKPDIHIAYLTPYQYGSVRITQVNGDIVTFTTTQGKTETLNVVSGVFQ